MRRTLAEVVELVPSFLFWSYVRVTDSPDECHPWTRAVSDLGYGKFLNQLAHRVALATVDPSGIGTNLRALHSCDNPPCCNPRHLRWGTAADNSADMAIRQRSTATLTDKQIVELRRLSADGATNLALAAQFGITKGAVGKIALGRHRKHVGGDLRTPRTRKLTPELKARIIALQRTGLSNRAIGRAVGLSHTAIGDYLTKRRNT